MKTLAVLTGAGMSADSGLATFRDSGGLWEGFNIEEVATVEGWQRNPKQVLEFYNNRREQAANAEPNEGHLAIAELEQHFDVKVITQNVDDLHERAGSTDVLHLHGMLKEARSSKDPDLVIDIGDKPIRLGDLANDGNQLRPNVVWFGEPVPNISKSADIVANADLLLIVGTSLAVYPAAGLINYAKNAIPKYIVDPSIPETILPEDWNHIPMPASTGVPKLKNKLIKNWQNE